MAQVASRTDAEIVTNEHHLMLLSREMFPVLGDTTGARYQQRWDWCRARSSISGRAIVLMCEFLVDMYPDYTAERLETGEIDVFSRPS